MAVSTIPSDTRLAAVRSLGGFRYTLTRSDVLWGARMAFFEGGRDPVDVLWTVLQRMVWYDIMQDSLQWNWERSEDKGKTWTVLWKIKYTRKK